MIEATATLVNNNTALFMTKVYHVQRSFFRLSTSFIKSKYLQFSTKQWSKFLWFNNVR